MLAGVVVVVVVVVGGGGGGTGASPYYKRCVAGYLAVRPTPEQHPGALKGRCSAAAPSTTPPLPAANALRPPQGQRRRGRVLRRGPTPKGGCLEPRPWTVYRVPWGPCSRSAVRGPRRSGALGLTTITVQALACVPGECGGWGPTTMGAWRGNPVTCAGHPTGRGTPTARRVGHPNRNTCVRKEGWGGWNAKEQGHGRVGG
jgi:hypothetical protein